MARHYHVLIHQSGYMPDTNDVCTSRRDAEEQAKFWADRYREDGTYKVEGSARTGGYRVMPKDASPYTLPTYIEITRCDFEECGGGDEW